MPHDRGVCVACLAMFTMAATVEQLRQTPARQGAEGPVDVRRLGETGWQAHEVQMLVPDELVFRTLDVADLRAPGGSLEMHDGSEKRIARSCDGVNVDPIELVERSTWLTCSCQRIGGEQDTQLMGPARAELPAMLE